MIEPKERERLILTHLKQVRRVAMRIHRRLPENVDLEDLVSAGTIGLIAAIDRFDPALGVALKTYAEHKIRGAILDSLRSLDWAPRSVRRRTREIEAASAITQQRLQRKPTEQEIADQLGLRLENYHKWILDGLGLQVIRLDSCRPNRDGALLECIAGDDAHWPSRLLEDAALQRLLSDALDGLPGPEGSVIRLHYCNGLKLAEIAKTMHLHPSRISQLKSRAIQWLRTCMQRQWPVAGAA